MILLIQLWELAASGNIAAIIGLISLGLFAGMTALIVAIQFIVLAGYWFGVSVMSFGYISARLFYPNELCRYLKELNDIQDEQATEESIEQNGVLHKVYVGYCKITGFVVGCIYLFAFQMWIVWIVAQILSTDLAYQQKKATKKS